MDCFDFNCEVYRKRICIVCGLKHSSVADLERHMLEIHDFWKENNENQLTGSGEAKSVGDVESVGDVVFEQKDFVDEVYTEYFAECAHLNMKTCEDIFSFLFNDIEVLLISELKRKKSIKASIAVETLFSKVDVNTGKDILSEPPPVFNSFQHAIFNTSMIPRFIRTICTKINLDHEFFTALRSGWNTVHITNITLKVIQISPIKGGTYIDLPLSLKYKEKSGCIVNIFNPPDEFGSQDLCFIYSVLAHDDIAGLKGKNRSRHCRNVENYKDPDVFRKINTAGMAFPIDVSQLEEQMSIFHENNKNISCTILGYHEDTETKHIVAGDVSTWGIYKQKQHRLLQNLFPLYSYDGEDERPIKVDLLLLFNQDMTNSHFILIRSLNSLLRSDNRYVRYTCRKCFQQFLNIDTLEEHKTLCVRSKSILRFPKSTDLHFKDFHKTLLISYNYFWDSESYLHKPDVDNKSFIHQHNCAGWSYNCVDWKGNLVSSDVYIQENPDDDPIELFLLQIFADIKCRMEMLDDFQKEAYTKMNLCDIDFGKLLDGTDERFTKCGFCKKPFNGQMVMHHNHLPDYNFEFFSCADHNLTARLPYIFNIYSHNATCYDHTHLLQSIHKVGFDDIQILAKSREKMFSIILRVSSKSTVAQIRFIDSLSFLQSSLANITKCLYDNGDGIDKFQIVREEFKEEIKKGVCEQDLFAKLLFPYKSLTCFEDLKRTDFLDASLYTNDLTKEDYTPADLKHVKQICTILNIKTLRELTSLYCRLDVALLSSVFTQFRQVLYKTFQLDISHYFSLPSYSYACALKSCEEELEYITQPDIYRFFSLSKRGGYSSVGSRLIAEASNPYLPSHLNNPSVPPSYISYLDCNALYSAALLTPLPTKNFRFLNTKDRKDLVNGNIHSFLNNLDVNGPKGYLLQVNLKIPDHLHSYFDDLPPAVEMKTIKKDQLSDYQMYFKEELQENDSIFTTTRLIADLNPKHDYVIHSRTLKKYIELGVEITKFTKILEFNQAAYFKSYIETLMTFRKLAKTKFESDLYKYLSNSLFGFTILDRERMMNVKVVTDKTKAVTYSNSPLLDEIISINENMLLFIMRRKSVMLSSPIQIGTSVLAISKAILYEYYYQVLKKHIPDVKICMIDTDGFIINTSSNIYDYMLETKEFHDLSGFDKNDPMFSKYHSMDNKSKVGKFKDENVGSIIHKIIAIRPKMYCFKYVKRVFNSSTQEFEFKEDGDLEVKKIKGIPKNVAKTDITYSQYFRALFFPKSTSVQFNTIQRRKHKLYTIQMTKKALCSLDIKRYRTSPSTTLAYGNIAIKEIHRKGVSYTINEDLFDTE